METEPAALHVQRPHNWERRGESVRGQGSGGILAPARSLRGKQCCAQGEGWGQTFLLTF